VRDEDPRVTPGEVGVEIFFEFTFGMYPAAQFLPGGRCREVRWR
jgi:hypothetical protein